MGGFVSWMLRDAIIIFPNSNPPTLHPPSPPLSDLVKVAVFRSLHPLNSSQDPLIVYTCSDDMRPILTDRGGTDKTAGW